MEKLSTHYPNLFFMLFILTFIPTSSQANVTFEHQGSYQRGSGPARVLFEDFNEDRKLDMAITNNSIHTVSIYLGNGDGSFQSAKDYSAGLYPWAILSGDFNKDGKLDIVTTNKDDTFTVLLGYDNGTFLPGETGGNTGTAPLSIASADFNGDKKLDIVTANKGTEGRPDNPSVSLFLGNGNGTFTTSSIPDYKEDLPYYYAYEVNTADFNKDGKADLAITYFWGSEIAVFLGNGDGTFNFVSSHNISDHYTFYSDALTITDINHDGIEDMLTIPQSGTGIVLLGHGDGYFTETIWSAEIASSSQTMVLSDFNCDGKHDMAMAGINEANIRQLNIYTGNGDGTFQQGPTYIEPTYFRDSNKNASIDAGDLNGDGKNDIAMLNYKSDRVNVYLNTTSPSVELCSVTADIKANGSDGPLSMNEGEMLDLTISLDPGIMEGFDADWWIYAESELMGKYWYQYGSGWIASETPIPAYQGPITSVTDLNVFHMPTLQAGNYDIYFQVDERNGIKEGARTDTVKVTIQ
ncbi:MAG: VCBS repeat-containing protein [Deltaproteobacteria bacterium]|nr:VCBS repeat-containing protein [Deltaproteobacteria bacterium]